MMDMDDSREIVKMFFLRPVEDEGIIFAVHKGMSLPRTFSFQNSGWSNDKSRGITMLVDWWVFRFFMFSVRKYKRKYYNFIPLNM